MELRRSCVRDQGPDRRGAGNPPPASSTPRGSIQDATRVTASASATSYGGALAGAVRLGTRTFEIVADQRGCSSSIHPPKARRRGRTGYRQRRSQSFSIGYNGRPRYAERGAGLPARTASPWSWDRAARAYQHKEPGGASPARGFRVRWTTNRDAEPARGLMEALVCGASSTGAANRRCDNLD
jgi:hypothetical protein